MVSEILEEAGLDRATARQLRRQLLEGVVLLCQWQLERMRETAAQEARQAEQGPGAAARRARRVKVE